MLIVASLPQDMAAVRFAEQIVPPASSATAGETIPLKLYIEYLAASGQHFLETRIGFFPFRGIFWFIDLRRKGEADHLARLRQRAKVFESNGLHQDVANSSRFHGTSNYRTTCGVGGELIQQTVFHPAANNVDWVQPFSGEFF